MYHVMHNTCIKHGRDIKTQYIGSTSILLLTKDWHPISNAIIFQETLPAYCIPKVVRMETGAVWHEKVDMSPRRPSQISLKHDWKRELGKIRNWAAIWKFPIEPTKFKSNSWANGETHFTHDVIGVQDDERNTSRLRRSRSILFCEESSSSERTVRLVETNVTQHVHLKTKKISMLNRHVSERGDLLTLMTWPMWKTVLKHVLLMKAKRSTLEMKYFAKERKDPLFIMTWVMRK